ncbi:MAG: T9SS type A sorting domain-containing protein [Ignavibacteria bacterium]
MNSFAITFLWVEQNSGTTQTLTSVHSSHSQNVWVCGYGGTVLRSTNRGANWINLTGNGIPTNIQLVNIVTYGNNFALTAGYLGTNTFVFHTSNAGVSWNQVFTQSNGFINAIDMKEGTIGHGFMMGNPVGGRWSLWKTTNGGVNWDSTGLYIPQAGNEAGSVNSLFSTQDNNIWFGTNNTRVYYSSNYGSSWAVQSTTGELNSYAIWFCGIFDVERGYLGGTTMQRSTDYGANWGFQTSIGTGSFGGISGGPNLVFDNSAGYLYRCYVRSDNRIYSAENIDTSWAVEYTAPSGTYRYVGSDHNGLNFWAVRNNGGISYLDLPVGISNNNTETPSDFKLEQNYPNPFNPSTKINYSILNTQYTILRVYDALGNEVAQLVNQKQNAGSYEVEFDGRNLPSGIYFYKLSAENFSDTKRMILLK